MIDATQTTPTSSSCCWGLANRDQEQEKQSRDESTIATRNSGLSNEHTERYDTSTSSNIRLNTSL